MQIEILFEDKDFAVVNKPAGVVVNDAETNREESIQNWWVDRINQDTQVTDWQDMVPADYPTDYGTPEEIFAERGGIVHRLDKETSGVMLLAKNPGALLNLLHQFKTRQVQKQYQCLVHGKFQIPKDTINLPLSRSRENRLRYAVMPDGRPATTDYEVQQFFPSINVPATVTEIHANFPNDEYLPRPLNRKLQSTYQGFSLVNCWPKTGRTHQIRVHMSHLKHPIVADEIYLGHKRDMLDHLWCPRLFLHAVQITFIHPRSNVEQVFQTELPAELQHALTLLNID